MDEKNGQRGMIDEMRNSFRVLHTLASYLCVPLAVVMSKGGKIGARYIGFPALVGLSMQFVIVALAGGRTAGEQALVACGLTVIALLAHRLHRGRVRRAGFRSHSMYTGEWSFPGDERAVKGIVVPVLAVLAGFGVGGFAPGAGLWLILAGASQALCTAMEQAEVWAQAQAQLDARYDQEIVARRREEMQ